MTWETLPVSAQNVRHRFNEIGVPEEFFYEKEACEEFFINEAILGVINLKPGKRVVLLTRKEKGACKRRKRGA